MSVAMNGANKNGSPTFPEDLRSGSSSAWEERAARAELQAFPAEARAVVYRPSRSAMTSGRARARDWILEFQPRSRPFIDPLTGWTGSGDTLSQVRLSFPSWEAALAYASRHGVALATPPVPAVPGTASDQADVKASAAATRHSPRPVDLDAALLDPAGEFGSPHDVVCHPALTEADKQRILTSWLWDARRIEDTATEGDVAAGEASRLEEVLEALALLDRRKAANDNQVPRGTEASSAFPTDGQAAASAGERASSGGC